MNYGSHITTCNIAWRWHGRISGGAKPVWQPVG